MGMAHWWSAYTAFLGASNNFGPQLPSVLPTCSWDKVHGWTAAESTGTIVFCVAPPITGTRTDSGGTRRKSASTVLARTQFNSTQPSSLRGLYMQRKRWISLTIGTILSTGSVATIVNAWKTKSSPWLEHKLKDKMASELSIRNSSIYSFLYPIDIKTWLGWAKTW